MFIVILTAKRNQKVAIRTGTGHHRLISSEFINKSSKNLSCVKLFKKCFFKSDAIKNSLNELEIENLNEVFSRQSPESLANEHKQNTEGFHFTYDYENG